MLSSARSRKDTDTLRCCVSVRPWVAVFISWVCQRSSMWGKVRGCMAWGPWGCRPACSKQAHWEGNQPPAAWFVV
jgi:hypothetical protein